MKKLCGIYSICFLAVKTLTAQTTVITNAEVDLAGRTFINNGLPFDESFNIKGKIGANVQKVTLKYKPISATEVQNYFVEDLSGEVTVTPWERLSDEQTFTVGPIRPLRPSSKYQFTFTAYLKASFSDAQKETLKRKITEKLLEYLNKPENLDAGLIGQLYVELNKLPNTVLNKKLTNINGSNIDIKPFEEPLKPFSNEIIELHNKKEDFETSLRGEISTVKTKIPLLSDTIPKIDTNQTKFSKHAKNTLELGVDTSIPEIGKIKIKDGIKILYELILNPELLKSLLQGSSKISSSGALIPSNVHDNASLIFLSSLLSIITSDNFTKIVNNKEQPFITNDSDLDKDIRQIATSLLQINTYKSDIAKHTQKLENYKQFIPDFLESVYTSASYEIIEASNIDVMTDKTPYISVDVGITGMFNPYQINNTSIGNNVYFFTHQAVNIYRYPVNKKAPLSMFKKPYRFWKSFSVHIGVAQLVGTFNSNYLSGSLNEKSSFMLGAGFRFNRVTKLSLSCIFLNQKSSNPTIDNTKLKSYLGLNFSADINVSKGFQDVGKALNFFK